MTDLHEIELNVALEQWSRLGPTATGFVSPMVTKLEKAGLLDVSLITPEDPIWNVTLTDAGRARLTRMGVLPGRDETEKAQPAPATDAETNAEIAAHVMDTMYSPATDAAVSGVLLCPMCLSRTGTDFGLCSTCKSSPVGLNNKTNSETLFKVALKWQERDERREAAASHRVQQATARAERAEGEAKRLREAFDVTMIGDVVTAFELIRALPQQVSIFQQTNRASAIEYLQKAKAKLEVLKAVIRATEGGE